MNTLKDKVVLITGTAQNIGKTMLREFAADGAIAIGVDIQTEKGEAVAAEIRSEGNVAEFYDLDIRCEERVELVINEIVAKHGRIDCLVNNAASYGSFGGTLDSTLEEHVSCIDTILFGTFLMTKYAVPHMIANGGGSIVNIGSVHGVESSKDMTSYHVAKAGLIMQTKQDAIYYGPQNIRVNAVIPGTIIGEESRPGYMQYLNVDTIEEAQKLTRESMRDVSPLGRWGETSEVAAAVRFFLTDGTYCEGACLVADGGSTL